MDPEPLRQLKVEEVIRKKDELEAELAALNSVLKSQGDVGMKGPLVDNEGFPRADIDVYAVRVARSKAIMLQNDHKLVMQVIEEKLHAIHAEARRNRAPDDAVGSDGVESGAVRGFLVVTEVTVSSPAAAAGLHKDDVICQFGSINYENFQTMNDVATVVQHSQNSPVRVLVHRDGHTHTLTLTPQHWTGPGLLGCRLVPLEQKHST